MPEASHVWPGEGVARIPYFVYSDPGIYELEQRTIFRGPVWHFLALEAELPEPGSFVTAQVGDTPVLVIRDDEGGIGAVVNRCSHKGTQLVYVPSGRLKQIMCIYHNWCFDLRGNCVAVAFENGIRGSGGMPAEFRKEDHPLRRLKVHCRNGLVFGSLSDAAPDFGDYIGPDMAANFARMFDRPITILGRYSQMLHANWKLYIENVADPYHATILHAFNGVLKFDRLTMSGGIKMGPGGRHHLVYSNMSTDKGGEIYETSPMRSAEMAAYGYGLRDPSITTIWDDHGDGITLAMQTIFPNFVLQQLRNCIAVRTVVPRGPELSELVFTAFAYADDDERRRALRLKQANQMGPAGYISIEDACAVNLVQRGIRGDKDKSAFVELGGRGIDPIPDSRASEGSVRGWWAGYRAVTGL
jgi:phenylpropionate dioxygenase-like ring-hydroxylating dioxygenase large terminal subunit